MNPAQPVCSLIIRCFNEEQHIGRLLTGIMQQTLKEVEIIVVDSGSTDATLDVASRFPVKIRHIQPEQFSFGRALNMGCASARGDFLVIVSAHVYPVHKDWLVRLIAPFKDSGVALVYGKQRGNTQTRYSERQVFARWFPDHSVADQSHPFCNNANAAVRRSLWQQFPYDEKLTGLEDVAWSTRIQDAGFRIAYEAQAEAVHVHQETPAHIQRRYQREAIALKRIFPHETFSLWDFSRLFLGNALSDCRHAGREGILWDNLRDIFSFRLRQFWGTYRGFCQHGFITSEMLQTFYYPHSWVQPPTPEPGVTEERPLIDYTKTTQDP